MVLEGEIGEFDLTVAKTEHVCVDEAVITHVIDLNFTVVILLEEV